jgi:radical SAM protein with 4Fe4S-binding SPASM domain
VPVKALIGQPPLSLPVLRKAPPHSQAHLLAENKRVPRRSPSIVWLELTSKCPLRCAFCSRKNLRGDGEDLDPALLAPLFDSLDCPEVLRLNYAGESANYPQLLEAIALARRRFSAILEMVTSLVTMPLDVVRALPDSGIDRISISLHTTDPARFVEIYGGGSLDAFERRLDLLRQGVEASPRPPVIDFAFVAMHRNAEDLRPVAALAASAGATALSIHPVIRRTGVPDVFAAESDSAGRLTDAFQTLLESQAEAARRPHAALPVVIARPSKAAPHPGPFLCEQNPFETTHILANGDVVPCEVLDRQPLGNLRQQPFERIWHGAAYDQFRRGYRTDQIPECATCMFRAPVIEVGCVTTSWGWHPADDSGTLWSRAEASFTCEPRGYPAMRLRGLLPAAPGGNAIHFRREYGSVVSFYHQGSEPVHFEVILPLDADRDCETFNASVDQAYSPWRHGMNGDTRQLGFAIFSAERGGEGRTLQTICKAPSVAAQTGAEILLEVIRAPIVPSPPDPPIAPPHDSLAVLIPERDHPTMLASCLTQLAVALGPLDLPFEVIVIANASDPRDYAKVRAEHPRARFLFYPSPLGFTAAIRHGLRYVTAGWTYLLNNDVRLHQEALKTILQQRAPRIFSLASRIRMDSRASDNETNRTALRFVDGLVDLTELDPVASGGHLYSGGGCSLFQTAWLRRFARQTACYDPFYWEDVEWGLRARAAGLENRFVAESLAGHAGKTTVRRFYPAEEVVRIFERNRIQLQLRCFPGEPDPAIFDRIASAPAATLDEWTEPRRLRSLRHARAWFKSRVSATSRG